MTNRERLADAEILKKDIQLSPEQEDAIEGLTPEEIDTLISVKSKVMDSFPIESLISPIAHHH
jgi:hypothetical protein